MEKNNAAPGHQPIGRKGVIWRLLLTFLLLVAGAMIWFVGTVSFAIGSIYAGWSILFWSIFMAAFSLFLIGAIFRRRHLRNVCGLLAAVFLVATAAPESWHYFTVTRHRQLRDRIDWWKYAPFRPDSKVVAVTPSPEHRIDGELPRINCAYALYPIAAGVVRALYPTRDYPNEILTADGSDRTFPALLEGKYDLILSPPPSKEQIEAAAKCGISYEITPFGREAFVFIVNRRNPAENLDRETIRRIYSGKITRWREAGVDSDERILPFQRNRGSGSQTMLEKIMGECPIMPPLKEDRVGGMGGIINDVADYRNRKEALGFSFRFFATEMFRNREIKLLSVDGIAPTRENIRNGTYPFLSDFCVITARPRSENTRKIVDFLLSPAGRELIEKTGYTALGGPIGEAPAK